VRYNAQSAYITERQNKCVTIHRARYNAQSAYITEQYKPERVRYKSRKNDMYYRTEKRRKQRVVTTNDVDSRNDN